MPDDYPVGLGPFLNGRATHADGVTTLALTGECDLAGVESVRALLAELEATAPRAIVVDLQALTFLDSSGVMALVDAHNRSRGARSFAVLNGSGPAHRALTLLGMDQLLTMVSSLDELDEEFTPDGCAGSG